MENYLEHNRQTWNARTTAHLTSEFYDVEGWLAGKDSLNSIELSLLPDDMTGLRILHLQCHFGQDTLSLARRGAHVTGVDLSNVAIDAARKLAKQAHLSEQSTFICSDIYDLPAQLDQTFDIVFTSYGTIGWLPDIQRWAEIVDKYLAGHGQFVFVEFHPIAQLWNDDRSALEYSYFGGQAIVDHSSGSYTDNSEQVQGTEVSWDHPVSQVINALIQRGLTLKDFQEYDYSPYDCFENTIEIAPGKYQFQQMPGLIPLLYSLDIRR